MNGTDKYFIEVTAAQLADICDTSRTDTPAVFNDDELLYIDPVRFKAYVKTQRAELWPAEFRQARDIINDYAQRSAGNVADDGTPHEEIFKAALICLHALALQMIPEHAGEIKADEAPGTPAPDDRAAGAVEIPAELARESEKADAARVLFRGLINAGYLTPDSQPAAHISERQAGYIAFLICDFLGTRHYCKTFAKFWGYKKNNDIAQGKRDLLKYNADGVAKINDAIAAAVEDNETLRARLVKYFAYKRQSEK